MSSSSGMASNPTCRVSCLSRSLSLVCKISIALLGLSETNTIGYIMRGYDYCGLQASGDAHRPQPASHSLPSQYTSDVGLDDAAPGSLLSLVERRQLFLHALALHLALGEGCLQRTSRLQHGP